MTIKCPRCNNTRVAKLQLLQKFPVLVYKCTLCNKQWDQKKLREQEEKQQQVLIGLDAVDGAAGTEYKK